MSPDTRQSVSELWSLITAVGKQLSQKRVHAEQCFDDKDTAIAILNIGRMNDGVQDET
jgi:hypothetical protein